MGQLVPRIKRENPVSKFAFKWVNLHRRYASVFNEQVNMFYGLGVGEYLEVSGTTSVTGAADFGSTLRSRGDAIFDAKITVTGTFTALGDYKIGDHQTDDALTVNAATTLNGDTTNVVGQLTHSLKAPGLNP